MNSLRNVYRKTIVRKQISPGQFKAAFVYISSRINERLNEKMTAHSQSTLRSHSIVYGSVIKKKYRQQKTTK